MYAVFVIRGYKLCIRKREMLFFGKDLRVSEGEPYKEVRKYDFSSYYPEEKRYNSNRQ